MKRALDLVLSAVLLVAALPVLAVAIAAIRHTSPGPAIFRQERVGRHGRPFPCLKLRTMHVGTPSVPTHEIDPEAITPVGRALRKFKIDELPQLWNVLCGRMSLVGPRPCLPCQAALVECRRRSGVFAVRPGMTGLAQVRGIDMSDPWRCAQADARYLRERSLLLDLEILWLTFRRMPAGIKPAKPL